jgi:hypothetical protein
MASKSSGKKDTTLLLLDRQIQQMGSGSGDPLRAFVIYRVYASGEEEEPI